MTPAVPFAALGVVQLLSAVTWLGLAVAGCFPQLRRPTTPLLVLGAGAMAASAVLTAVTYGGADSQPLGWLRAGGLLLLAAGLAAGALRQPGLVAPAVVAPLGAGTGPAVTGAVLGLVAAVAAWTRARGEDGQRLVAGWLAAALVVTAVGAGLARPATTSTRVADAELAVTAAAALCLAVALVLLTRTNLLGKLLLSIVAGVVAMALGAVAVVGIGVANQVQSDQSARLTSVATAQQQNLSSIAARAGLFARVVAQCPKGVAACTRFLDLFSVDPAYFAVLDRPGHEVTTVAAAGGGLSHAALLQLAGSPVVQSSLARSAGPTSVAVGPALLAGSTPRLAVVAAVPGRVTANAQSRPSYSAVYGIVLTDAYLQTLRATTGYDVSVVADGRLIASSLSGAGRQQLLAVASARDVDNAPATSREVVAAQGRSPSVAFVPVTEAGNDDVRIATLAVSQPASIALAAQRDVLRRLVLTGLVALIVVAGGAVVLARRIANPVRRLTVAADRVRRGDLDTPAPSGGLDEVGSLARSFGAMTLSLRGLTGDLRAAAAEEAALRARLETVIDSMTDGLVATGAGDVVTAANAMAVEQLGAVSTSDVVGRPLAEVLSLLGVDGQPYQLVERGIGEALVRRSGRPDLPVRVAVAPLEDGAGRVVVLGDRTREREVERMKTEFLANVSHELRTPLTPIRGYAELLGRRALDAGQVSSFAEQILASTARMQRVVELLVDVAALDAGRVEPRVATTSVRSLVDGRLAAWRTRWPARAGDLHRSVAARLPGVEVDPMWVGKALDEIADNAVKLTAAGTPITLAASVLPSGLVRLVVRDRGPGIDPERSRELLGDFAQADGSETRRVEGLGLGLGVVSRVAERFSLEVTIAARPGGGSDIGLDLPVAPRPPS